MSRLRPGSPAARESDAVSASASGKSSLPPVWDRTADARAAFLRTDSPEERPASEPTVRTEEREVSRPSSFAERFPPLLPVRQKRPSETQSLCAGWLRRRIHSCPRPNVKSISTKVECLADEGLWSDELEVADDVDDEVGGAGELSAGGCDRAVVPDLNDCVVGPRLSRAVVDRRSGG